MRRAVLLVLAVAPAAAAPARADVRLEGHGFGHAVGLQQWGAYGYARVEHRDARWIVRHYYPGTSVARGPSARVRVLLKASRTQTVCGATRARDARRRSVRLVSGRRYRVSTWQADGVVVRDLTTHRVRAHLRAPVRVTGGTSVCLRGTALNGRANRAYRGALRLLRDGREVAVVNDVALEHYLYGVVPAESPSYWPQAALQAQALAARSYALRSLKPTAPFDVLPSTASQVYGGVEEETAATTAAVQAVRGQVVMTGGEIAATYFSASSGGRTVPVEEGFPGASPAQYLTAVDDPHDDLSPYHDWTATFTDKQAAKALGDAVQGDFEGLEVSARTATDRAATVVVHGSDGDTELPATTVRARLDLKSTWFSVATAR